MNTQQEADLKAYLDSLNSQELSNVKSHADVIDDENHDSFSIIKNMLVGIGITRLTGGIGGGIWKAIKLIKGH